MSDLFFLWDSLLSQSCVTHRSETEDARAAGSQWNRVISRVILTFCCSQPLLCFSGRASHSTVYFACRKSLVHRGHKFHRGQRGDDLCVFLYGNFIYHFSHKDNIEWSDLQVTLCDLDNASIQKSQCYLQISELKYDLTSIETVTKHNIQLCMMSDSDFRHELWKMYTFI